MALSNASFLPDEKDCAESWRAQRWSDGVHCVVCGSTKVESRSEQYRGHRYPGTRVFPPVVHTTPLVRCEDGDGVV